MGNILKSKTFKKVMKSIGNNFKNTNYTDSKVNSISIDLLTRNIGIVGKNYNFIKNTLQKNIGNGLFSYDGYGTEIGSLGDPMYNSKFMSPWFYIDNKKNSTCNYLDYIDKTYFKGSNSILKKFYTSETLGEFYDNITNSLSLDNAKVGAIRNYFIGTYNPTSPNNIEIDSALGEQNRHILDSTMINASNNRALHKNENGITMGFDTLFGFYGQYGMERGYFNDSDKVISQEALTSSLIPWSTSDHMYNSMVAGEGINRKFKYDKRYISRF